MSQHDLSERARACLGIREYRDFVIDELELRAGSDPNVVEFTGVASTVDAPYTVRDAFGEFTETIAAGAFNRTLNNPKADVALHVNHRWDDIPLASRLAVGATGTMRLVADPNLRVFATLDAERSDVQILRSAIRDGIMREMSIGMTVPKDKQTWNADYTDRVVREAHLLEASIVKQGANRLTSTAVRSAAELLESLVDVEMTEEELRRAIAALEERLPAPEVNPFAERDRADMDRLLRLKASAPALVF